MLLEVKNLTKIYDGEVLALDQVSFQVEDGQFMAAIGLSGSGKSTLLRCINRLVEPTAGRVIWNGVDQNGAAVGSGVYFVRLFLDRVALGEPLKTSLLK